jgi:hypothetical protein
VSVRAILEALRASGGRATLRELQRIHPYAGSRLAILIRQGYVERDGPATYKLSSAGSGNEEGRAGHPPHDVVQPPTPASRHAQGPAHAGNDPVGGVA